MVDTVIIPLLKIAVVVVNVALFVPIMTLLERKVQGWVQSRLGPMRVGPSGLLQPIAERFQAATEGGHHPDQGRQMAVHPGADSGGGAGAGRLFGDPVWRG